MDTLKKLKKNGVNLEYSDIVMLCRKYHITKLSIFGSAIRDDFKVSSDIDILVKYENYIDKNQLYDFIYIRDDFKKILKRNVDVVDIDELTNPIRRKRILSTAEVIYVDQ